MTPNMYTNSGIHILKEVALNRVVGDLPEILRLIEGVPCINAENSGVAGGHDAVVIMLKRGLVS